MPFSLSDVVGIFAAQDDIKLPDTDTGKIAEVLPNRQYNVSRDILACDKVHQEPELFLLSPARTIKKWKTLKGFKVGVTYGVSGGVGYCEIEYRSKTGSRV